MCWGWVEGGVRVRLFGKEGWGGVGSGCGGEDGGEEVWDVGIFCEKYWWVWLLFR